MWKVKRKNTDRDICEAPLADQKDFSGDCYEDYDDKV